MSELDIEPALTASGDGDTCTGHCENCGKHCGEECGGGRGGCCRDSRSAPRGKLSCYNWLADVPSDGSPTDIVEVEFKNTRKGYYRNSLDLPLEAGQMVVVESVPGHDVGRVTLMGPLVALQMRKAGLKPDSEIRRVYRIAKPADLEKYEEARAREQDTMIRSRRIAEDLGLNMKIGDVEYQGDGNKAIFYYIADERVDFRQLIKILAEAFHVRIEMRQIGARQEAGRIGGIGPCGRPLCCASWMTNFVSVSTAAARFQDISPNPQKLAGQCAKLKCCLNFESDIYAEALKKLPPRDVRLETADATYVLFKRDILSGELVYSTDKNVAANLTTIDAARAFEIIEMNRRGEKPLTLTADNGAPASNGASNDLLDQNSLTRFDNKKRRRNNKRRRRQDDNEPANADSADENPSDSAGVETPNQGADSDNRNNRRHGDRGRNRHNNRRQQNRQEGNNRPSADSNSEA